MLEVVLGEPSRAFSIALCLVAGLALLEAVLLMLGASAAGWLDDALPHHDIPHADIGHGDLHGGDAAGAHGPVGDQGGVLDWLGVGRAPLLVVLIALLTSFGLTGLVVQAAAHGLTGQVLPAWAAGIPAVVAAAFGTRWLSRGLARLLPAVETSAGSIDQFVGQRARLTLGDASPGMPAQAKLRDRSGRTHYLLVEPEAGAEPLAAGSDVLLIARRNAVFLARRA